MEETVVVAQTQQMVPETMPATWAEFTWPDWVLDEVRREVERFWGCWGRTPRSWAEDAVRQGAPAFGEVVTLRAFGGSLSTHVTADGSAGDEHRRTATGRYVHAWNNIGRLVHEDGSFDCVSFANGLAILFGG